jgi:hypothetical protein
MPRGKCGELVDNPTKPTFGTNYVSVWLLLSGMMVGLYHARDA